MSKRVPLHGIDQDKKASPLKDRLGDISVTSSSPLKKRLRETSEKNASSRVTNMLTSSWKQFLQERGGRPLMLVKIRPMISLVKATTLNGPKISCRTRRMLKIRLGQTNSQRLMKLIMVSITQVCRLTSDKVYGIYICNILLLLIMLVLITELRMIPFQLIVQLIIGPNWMASILSGRNMSIKVDHRKRSRKVHSTLSKIVNRQV